MKSNLNSLEMQYLIATLNGLLLSFNNEIMWKFQIYIAQITSRRLGQSSNIGTNITFTEPIRRDNTTQSYIDLSYGFNLQRL
jgi:hypothetical protein